MNDRTKDYVFLSYSHSDNINDILTGFQNHGYNIVYDTAMSYGEEWDLNARRYISSSKCKGVVFLISENAVISKSILTEVGYTMQFRKKSFVLLMGNLTLSEMYVSLYSKLNANQQYIMSSIIEAFPPEQLFVKKTELSWSRTAQTLQEWDFFPDSNADASIAPITYSSVLTGEKKRLDSQQKGYYAFDQRAIDLVLHDIKGNDLCVIDLGCSNGALTISRFANIDSITKVIGVDYNATDIEEAKASASIYGNKFSFYHVDLEDPLIVQVLTSILKENGREKADIIFGALVLHHLKYPSKLLLRLYDVMSEDGKIILRGSDDGGKLCYPNSDLLNEILTRYSKIVKNSDRSNGRKLYTQLYNAGYVNIRMLYSCVDTCEKDRRSRERLFDVGFSFRLHRLEDLTQKNPNNAFLKKEKEWFAKALAEFKEIFVERNFWYCNTSYIAIAGVK